MQNATREARRTNGGLVPVVGWDEFTDSIKAGDPSAYAIPLTTAALGGGASFTQAAVDRFTSTTVDADGILGPLLVGRVAGLVWADQGGTLYLEESEDATAWTTTITQAVAAKTTTELAWAKLSKRYYRFRYVNGATAQGAFCLYQRVGGQGRRDVEVTASNVSGATGSAVPSQASLMGVSDGISLQALRSIAALADGQNNAGMLGAGDYAFNGASWDRNRNNSEGTLLASSARTTTTNIPNQTNFNAKGVVISVRIVAVPGNAETLTVVVRFVEPVGGSASNGYAFATTIPGTATVGDVFRFIVYPGAVETVSHPNFEVCALPLPRTWAGTITHSGSGTWNYSVGYQYIV